MTSKIANKYGEFLQALEEKNVQEGDVGFMIFYDLFKIREAQVRYKFQSKRAVDFSLSDIFQDLVAHYLRSRLNEEYEVILEHTQNKLRPDILIRKSGKNIAIIEIKTTIGWNRDLVKNDNYLLRLEKLSNEFCVPLNKVFYIFEASRNVNKEFNDCFKTDVELEIKNYIFPLFEFNASPYYFSKKFRKNVETKYSDNEILELYNKYKRTDFEKVISKILN